MTTQSIVATTREEDVDLENPTNQLDVPWIFVARIIAICIIISGIITLGVLVIIIRKHEQNNINNQESMMKIHSAAKKREGVNKSEINMRCEGELNLSHKPEKDEDLNKNITIEGEKSEGDQSIYFWDEKFVVDKTGTGSAFNCKNANADDGTLGDDV